MDKPTITIKPGKLLTKQELKEINSHRQRVFQSDDPISINYNSQDRTNLFILVKDNTGHLLSFAKVHPLNLHFAGQIHPVHGFSTIVSTQTGKGYGKLAIEGIKKLVRQTNRTAIGFCETALLPFYRNCGLEILTPQDNQFVYVNALGKIIPGIVPGEVIYIRGKDQVMEKILNSTDKTVKIPRD